MRLTRRQFLRSGMVLGAGFASIPHLALMQEQAPEATEMAHIDVTGAIVPIHDPCIIKAEDAYYVFCTGDGILVKKSVDLVHWTTPFPASVFPHTPDWALEQIPGATNIWAPDISFHNGKYQLYYAVSTFGSNRSVIGLATNTTLDSKADGFEWVDQGLVIESQRSDSHNCIDPNFALDANGNAWLAFGSFWTGIKLRRLDNATGKPTDADPTVYSLARRPDRTDAIEAAFIIRKGDFYYLFVSFDFCCRGADSTYRVMVGRSDSITGAYADRDGTAMLEGGGTQVTFPTDRWRGPGHNGILQENGVEYIVYHAYDAEHLGTPTLRIDRLDWDADGWPSIAP